MDTLFDTQTIAQDEVTIHYTEGSLIVTLNFKTDRHYEIVFQRMTRGIAGIADCKPYTSHNRKSDNTSFIVTLSERANLNQLPKIHEDIKALAARHADFILSNPLTQTSLF